MKKKIMSVLLACLFAASYAGCGTVTNPINEDPVEKKFQSDVDSFCTQVAAIDKKINDIDSSDPDSPDALLDQLDKLDQLFQVFAQIDAPAQYDYIESLADDASSYMSEAVKAYHDAFAKDSYNEYKADYAAENYERAYKRITVIMALLNGDSINEEGVTITVGSSSEN